MLFGLLISTISQAQWTAIPDSNFEQALIDLGIDNVLDGQVLTASVDTVTVLDVRDKSIDDINGVEDFTSLIYLLVDNNELDQINLFSNVELKWLTISGNNLSQLNLENNNNLELLTISGNNFSNIDLSNLFYLQSFSCYDNQIDNLDISNNSFLTRLYCDRNNINNIDLSNNQLLIDLYLNYNNLTSIDLSNNSQLEQLMLGYNNISQIDLQNQLQLKELGLSGNPIEDIDISQNQELISFGAAECELIEIDISNNQILTHIGLSDNQLSSINFSSNPNLESIYITHNQITSLDFSNNNKIQRLHANNNSLFSLNLRNSNNLALNYLTLNNNPNLTCIEVDDAAWSEENWTQIDPQMYFSENCGGGAYTEIPDPYFEQALIDLELDDVLDGQVLTASVDTVTVLNVDNKNISDLAGIEAFINLSILKCGFNQLTNLDLLNNPMLTHLYAYANRLTDINIQNLSKLTILDVSDNLFNQLDLSNSLKIKEFYCINSGLTSLNLSNCPELQTIVCFQNYIETLRIDNSASLMFIDAHNNMIETINLSTNIALEQLFCYDNQLITADLSNNPNLISISCQNNNLEEFNLKNGNNLNMPSIGVTGNPSLSCIQVDDPAWSEANWTNLDSQMYFSAFCGASGDDSDGDGVPDDFDDFPMDELRAFDNYFPATGYGSLAFEDLWPGTGDYDFNDVVVDYRFEMVTNASNKVVEVFGSFVLKASGASLRNGFGFNLPAASTNLINNLNEVQVSGHHVTESFVSLLENGFEAGQSKPTIIVFDDFYNVMEHPGSGLGINTEPDKPFVEFDTLNVLIKPNEAIFGLSDFQFENWNPFIIVNNDRGREIHLADHAPTDLVDVSVFGSYEDSTDPSTGRYYKTSNNLPWAIHIIQEFVWPQEKISIVEAYHHFFEWANSSGTEFDDWYENHNGYRDDDKLYLHE